MARLIVHDLRGGRIDCEGEFSKKLTSSVMKRLPSGRGREKREKHKTGEKYNRGKIENRGKTERNAHAERKNSASHKISRH